MYCEKRVDLPLRLKGSVKITFQFPRQFGEYRKSQHFQRPWRLKPRATKAKPSLRWANDITNSTSSASRRRGFVSVAAASAARPNHGGPTTAAQVSCEPAMTTREFPHRTALGASRSLHLLKVLPCLPTAALALSSFALCCQAPVPAPRPAQRVAVAAVSPRIATTAPAGAASERPPSLPEAATPQAGLEPELAEIALDTAEWRAEGVVVRAPSWPALWTALADRSSLGLAAKKIPPGVYALVTEVVPGVGQVALHSFSLGDTGFVSSQGRYNPASSVKIIAAVGALQRMAGAGFSSAAIVTGKLDGQTYRGPMIDLVQRALVYSDNEAYDWLQALAGHDTINEAVLGRPFRWPALAVRSRFSPHKTYGFFSDTPAFGVEELGRRGELPALRGHPKLATCPNNCVSLAALQDITRRTVLHWEIDPAHRFALPPQDIAAIREFIHHAADRFSEGAAPVLGGPVHSYTRFGNTTGWFTGNGLVVRHKADAFVPGLGTAPNAPRYLLTFAAPWQENGSGPGTKEATPGLVTALLTAAKKAPRNGPPIQPDAGERPEVALFARDNGSILLEIAVREGAIYEAWLGRERVTLRREGGPWTAKLTLRDRAMLVIRVVRSGLPTGHISREIERLRAIP